jgi:hypothetical protein
VLFGPFSARSSERLGSHSDSRLFQVFQCERPEIVHTIANVLDRVLARFSNRVAVNTEIVRGSLVLGTWTVLAAQPCGPSWLFIGTEVRLSSRRPGTGPHV